MDKNTLIERLSELDASMKTLKDEMDRLSQEIKSLRAKYVEEYGCYPVGSKIRVTVVKRYYLEDKDITFDAFVAENVFKEGCAYGYASLYDDKSIKTKLLKIKKNGTPSCIVHHIECDSIKNIELLEIG